MKNKLSELRSIIRGLVKEAMANKFGQGGDIAAAEQVANSHWGNVYLVMPKGESNNNVFYRVTLHNANGPVKFLKQDPNGRWFFMEPPQQVWRPVNPAKVATNECATCGCGDPTDDHKDDMSGDTTDVKTMYTTNVSESEVNYKKSSDASVKAYSAWRKSRPIYNVVHAFVAGYNAGLVDGSKPGLNEQSTLASATPGGQEGGTIRTPYAFSKKTPGKKAMDVTKKMGYKPAGKGY